MSLEYRYAKADEFPAIADLDGASFGFVYSEQELADATLDVDPDRMLVAVDDGRIVGASCEVPFELTLPGGRVGVTGLTWVSVEITHRRRGIQRSLMEQQIRTCSGRGDAAMILFASEGGIYGRYGYGIAGDTRKVVIDRGGARLRRPVDGSGVTRLSTEQARDVLPGIYDRWRQQTPGAVDRNANRWQLQLLDRAGQRHGMSGLFHLVHADGYVSYRIKSEWNDGHPAHVCFLVDYVVITPEAHAALWQVLLAMDMVGRFESYRVPLDDPLPQLLTDPRRVRTVELNDGLWVRPLDVAALLSARTYAVDVAAVLQVRDPVLGAGSYRLVGGPDGARCEASRAEPDVVLDVAELGSLVLGGRRLPPLVAAGRVQVADRDLVTRLDRALLGDVAPQHGTSF